MARSKEFSKDKVIEQAMLLFWAKGFEATSMRDLQSVTGISSSSMYEAFGDKRGLYLAALERFCQYERQRIAQMAQDAASPQRLIEQLFASLEAINAPSPNLTPSSNLQGSLAFKAMVEFGTLDTDITALLLTHYFGISEIIAETLRHGQREGAITTQADPLHLAYTILSTLQGVATLKEVKPDFAFTSSIAQIVLQMLK